MFYLLIFKYLKLMIAMHIFFLIGQFQIFCLFKYKNFIPENRKSEKYKKSKYFVNKKKTFVSHLWFRVLGGKHGTTWCLNRETVRKILGPFRRGVSRFRRFAFRVSLSRFRYTLLLNRNLIPEGYTSKYTEGS